MSGREGRSDIRAMAPQPVGGTAVLRLNRIY